MRSFFIKPFPDLDGSSNRDKKRYRTYRNDEAPNNLSISRGLYILILEAPDSSQGLRKFTIAECEAARLLDIGGHGYINSNEISLVDKNVLYSKTEKMHKDDDRA